MGLISQLSKQVTVILRVGNFVGLLDGCRVGALVGISANIQNTISRTFCLNIVAGSFERLNTIVFIQPLGKILLKLSLSYQCSVAQCFFSSIC